MTKEQALQATREWREQMMRDWEGKTPEQIRQELNETGRRFQETHQLEPIDQTQSL
jgi:broad specificity phosphatase PhoE